MRTETRLAWASLAIGAVLGFLGAYSLWFELQPLIIHGGGYPIAQLASAWASLIVTYPVTVFVFYMIGRRPSSGFRTGRSLFVIFFSSLLGQVLGQVLFSVIPKGGASFGLPFSLAAAPPGSLNFLFVAFSGYALSNLSRQEGAPASKPRMIVLFLVAVAFGLEGSFAYGFLVLGTPSLGFALLGELALVAAVVSLPLAFLVFYYVGRRATVEGHTFRYFGYLFAGLYVGGLIGAAVSVVLFGQAFWFIPPGQQTLSLIDGVVYQSVPPSLAVLFVYLNPIRSLPFLPFFAMSVSRTSRPLPNPDAAGASQAPA